MGGKNKIDKKNYNNKILILMRISNSIEHLDSIHFFKSWIPSGEQIRPLPEILEKKEKDNLNFSSFYSSIKDQILIRYFNYPIKINRVNNKIESKIILDNVRDKRFVKNEYPYQVPIGTYHYVMWYTYQDISDNQIDNDIWNSLYKLVGHRDFEFVWYENPKMSVSEVYHVQVFWHLVNS